MRDVIVVGGGPSGLYASRKLAEQGLDVLLLEKKREIGEHVVCTGIVGLRAFKEFGLFRKSVLQEVQRVTLFSPLGESWDYEHHSPFACVVDRESFDRSLKSQAILSGAEIRNDHEVLDIIVGRHSAEVVVQKEKSAREKFSSKTVLLATGINYRFHKKLKLGYPKHFLNGVQAECELGQVDNTKIFIGRSVAPGAFAWLVPVGNERARIGLMTEKNPEGYFEQFLRRIAPERAATLDASRIQTKVIAQGLVSRTFGDRVLAVGEAAGQIKTTTGGGIYFGLLGSDIAVRVLSHAFLQGRFSSSDLAEYERSWKKALQQEISLGLSLRKFFGKFGDSVVERIFRLAKNDGIVPLARERADFDWHSDLLLTMLKRIPYLQSLGSRGEFCSNLRMG